MDGTNWHSSELPQHHQCGWGGGTVSGTNGLGFGANSKGGGGGYTVSSTGGPGVLIVKYPIESTGFRNPGTFSPFLRI